MESKQELQKERFMKSEMDKILMKIGIEKLEKKIWMKLFCHWKLQLMLTEF